MKTSKIEKKDILKEVIGKIKINSLNSYSIDGEEFQVFHQSPYTIPLQKPEKFGANDQQNPQSEKQQLTQHLTGAIYARVYAGMPKMETVTQVSLPPKKERIAFMDQLSQANQSLATPDLNWKVYHLDSQGNAFAEKNGILRPAQPGSYIQSQPNLPLQAGQIIHFHRVRENRDFQNVFYHGYGNEFLQIDGPIVRLYFNLKPEGATKWIAGITDSLNQYRIPFNFKCLNHPALYNRRDAAVLYFDRKNLALVLCLITPLVDSLENEMNVEIPLFTGLIAKGVGIAEDPGQGQSFGMNRAEILGNALVDAFERKLNGAVQISHVKAAFKQQGLDLEKLWCQPNSTLLLKSPIPSNSSQEEQTQQSPFQQTAQSIVKDFIREAIWSEDGKCTWQGASLENINGSWVVMMKTFGPDLYSGISGIVYFLSEAALRLEDPLLLPTLEGAVNTLIYQVEEDTPPLKWGLHSGQLGMGYALWRAGKSAGRKTWEQKGLKWIKAAGDAEILESELDVITGPAGSIPVLIKVWKETNQEVFLKMAKKAADSLLERAKKEDDSWWWESIPGNPGLTGYSHGAAGFGLAFLELWAITQKPEYWQAGQQSFQYERKHFLPQQGNWPDLRTDISTPQNHAHQPTCGEMWCHGAPGIALSRLRAYELTQDQSFLQEAQIALSTTARSVQRSLANPNTASFCLCHGLAGNADILITGSKYLQQPQLFELAQQAGQLGIQLHAFTGVNWTSGVNDPSGATPGMEPTPGLMLGSAGTGLFYLRLAFPEINDSILLIH